MQSMVNGDWDDPCSVHSYVWLTFSEPYVRQSSAAVAHYVHIVHQNFIAVQYGRLILKVLQQMRCILVPLHAPQWMKEDPNHNM